MRGSGRTQHRVAKHYGVRTQRYKPIYVYEGPTPEGKMYLLMAMFQIGGWVGEIDENLPYPLDFEIDHVKVWRKNP